MYIYKNEKEKGKVRQEIKPFKQCHQNYILTDHRRERVTVSRFPVTV
jgi:hypothetical protein